MDLILRCEELESSALEASSFVVSLSFCWHLKAQVATYDTPRSDSRGCCSKEMVKHLKDVNPEEPC